MKKLLLALLLAFMPLVALAAPITQTDPMDETLHITAFTHVDDSTNATVSLVTGVTGRYIVLEKYTLSLSTADNVYLECATTAITSKKYLAANSGLSEDLYPYYIVCPSGDSLQLVKGTSTTPVGVDVWYTITP